MDTKKLFLALGILVVLVIGGFALYSRANQPSDEVQIQRALADSIKASREGRAGGVAELLGDRMKLNDMPADKRQILNAIIKNKPEVQIADTKPLITGDEARIVSPVHIKANYLTVNFDRDISQVTLIFRKEAAREWLLIPTQRWRLEQVFVPDSVMQEVVGGF